MSGHTTQNTEFLTRTDLWTKQLKAILEDELIAQKYVRWMTDFPDGDVFHIPSIGQIAAKDYVENQDVDFESMDTGDFEFQVTEYIQSGTYITNKQKQDSFYSQELISQFIPREHRALMKRVEVDVLRIGPAQQTNNDPNEINDLAHRWLATGTRGTQKYVMSVEDFARARLALQMANVPMTNLIAIVDPSVEFSFNTIANFTNLLFNPKWEGIVKDGIGNGMQFKVNILGFDVYVSHNLPTYTAQTIYGEAATGNLKANLFFSAAPDVLPLIGAVRQTPVVDSKYNMYKQREEFVTTMRYGVKLFREDNFITVFTDGNVADPTYSA